jgi:hypothetical protein
MYVATYCWLITMFFCNGWAAATTFRHSLLKIIYALGGRLMLFTLPARPGTEGLFSLLVRSANSGVWSDHFDAKKSSTRLFPSSPYRVWMRMIQNVTCPVLIQTPSVLIKALVVFWTPSKLVLGSFSTLQLPSTKFKIHSPSFSL